MQAGSWVQTIIIVEVDMENVAINPASVAKAQTYSHGIKVGSLLFVAGQVARDAQGRMVGIRDIRAQTAQVYENIKAVLAEAGAGFDNVVKTTSYLVNMDLNYQGYSEARAKYLPKDKPPASTLVEVKSLVPRDALIEVEAVAVLD